MRYKFISRTLLTNETLKIVSLYLDLKDWNEVKKIVLEENLLQKNKVVSLQKQFSEIKTRVDKLTDKELEYASNFDLYSSRLVFFIGVAKKYRLLYEFLIEVLRDKFLTFNYTIFDYDYENFLRSKYDNYSELEEVKQDTRIKLKRNLFKILEEVGIIDSTENKNIIKPFVPEELIKIIVEDNPNLLAIFLMSDSEILMYKEKYNI
ncbi:MAG: DUF1819 family protein [Candidatus Sericytochromatia bacterium]